VLSLEIAGDTMIESKRIPIRRLGDIEVGAIGIGCNAMTGFYGETDKQEAITVFRKAHEYGVTLFDTADCYGPYTSEEAVGRAMQGLRDKIILSTKGGLSLADPQNAKADGRPEYLRKALDDSLKRLRTDYVDLYYLHRPDPDVPIEDSVGFLSDKVRDGKIRAIGLSEVTVATLDRAHAVHPISCVESELSLWTREPLDEIVPWCEAHNVGFVPYSPLGRGYLTGRFNPSTKFAAGDFRATNPRFTEQAMRQNEVYIDSIRAIAKRHGSTAAAVALAWILAQGENLVPIPGMEKLQFVEENVGATRIALTDEDLALLDALPPAAGDRYAAKPAAPTKP
jgi:aryl-alcohol dehydrogenase-like predicted oxidoreductase